MARLEIEQVLEKPVHLDLWVKRASAGATTRQDGAARYGLRE